MPDSVTKTPKHRPLDDETAAALTLFNTYLVAHREQQAHERALKKAEKAKDEAAAAVRKLNDKKASSSETPKPPTGRPLRRCADFATATKQPRKTQVMRLKTRTPRTPT